MRFKGLFALLVVPAAGCTVTINHDFPPPNQAGLQLGVSREADIVAAEGQPTLEAVFTRPPVEPEHPTLDAAKGVARYYDVLRYSYGGGVLGVSSLQRTAIFTLADGKLCRWSYSSTDPARSSDFDAGAAGRLLAKGNATLAQITALIGPPGGGSIYPLTARPEIRTAAWDFAGPAKGSNNVVTKRLVVALGPGDQIVDYVLRENEAPPPAPRGTTVVPIIVHR